MSFKHPKPVIGIVGGIGSGKSFVAAQFEKLGCGVINADQLAKDAYLDPGIHDQLISWWCFNVSGLLKLVTSLL